MTKSNVTKAAENSSGDEPKKERRNADRCIIDRRAGTKERRRIDDKHYVFRESELGEMAFIVVAGTVEIVKHIEGKDLILGTVGRGAIFGEMALVDDKPRMASARAAGGAVDLIVITREEFRKQISSAEPFVRGMIDAFADHIRTLAEALAESNTRAS